MQRKKSASSWGAPRPSVRDPDDDGGAAKRRPSLWRRPPRAKRLRPRVPAALWLTLLGLAAFAALLALGAGGPRRRRGPPSAHLPAPLLEERDGAWRVQRPGGAGAAGVGATAGDRGGATSSAATRRMRAQPSRFVDAEKQLKRQLKQLLESQHAEKNNRQTPRDSDGSVLGVKIATRYLGEDLLPYPASKGDEKEWEKKMEQRKAELRAEDESEWNALMRRYDEVMERNAEENERVDHALNFDADRPEKTVQRQTDPVDGRDTSPEGNEAMRPPRGSEKWPSPSEKAGADTTLLIKPAFGAHRPSHDAILVFAEGYDLSIYLAFVESLVNTGYDGDVVFSISEEKKLKPGVKEYLQSHNAGAGDGGVNIVTYEVNWSCFKQSGEATSGANAGISHCKMNHAFGDAAGRPIADPRDPRPVATARYEIYWMWSLRYERESWLMLIDARDVWFQRPPFGELKDRGKVSGELHLFGENADAVRIGTSDYNRRWLVAAYGRPAVSPYFEEPVICSGSTIGNQDAIETYLRAMVAEYDATLCKQKGCDQGFHNYLYYSGKLRAADSEGIAKVIVHEQGKSIINNLGALRTKPLKEWGLYDAEKQLVLNWDGTTSAVAHQYDRDKEANVMVKGKKREFSTKWSLRKRKTP